MIIFIPYPSKTTMSKTLTITLSDVLEQALAKAAHQTNQSAEELILQLLAQTLNPPSPSPSDAADPLLKLIGCITTDVTDVAANHDRYLGQALYEEIHDRE
jgi:hypothetical protein